MSLTPAFQINFDSVGLDEGDDYVLDASGIGHFHQVKAGSTWVFRLQFPGIDTTILTWTMHVRSSLASTDVILGVGEAGDAAITVNTDPDGDNTEEVEFRVEAAGTELLQNGGAGTNFVYDIFVMGSGQTDAWVEGSGTVDPAVTR